MSRLQGAVVAVIAFGVAARAQQPDAQISGRVVRADNGAPIADATVQLMQTAGNPIGNGRAGMNGRVTARTDSAGRYVVQGLPEGAYLIWASAAGYLDGDANEQLTDRGQDRYPPARPLPKIDSTSRLRNVDFHLLRSGSVSGSVLTKGGLPLRSGVAITAIRVLARPGGARKYVLTGSRDTTDTAGHFTLPRLRPDTYLVCVNCFTDHNVVMDSSGGIRAFGDGATLSGDTPSAANAKTVILGDGEHRTDLRIVAGPLRLYTVTIWPTGPDSVPRPSMRYNIHLSTRFEQAARQPDGSFRLRDVPPGHYALFAYADGVRGLGEGSLDVDIGDTDVVLHVPIAAGTGSVRGVARWEGTPDSLPGAAVLSLTPVGDRVIPGWPVMESAVGVDGSFHFSKLRPGRYLITFAKNPFGITLEHARCNGMEVTLATPLRIDERPQQATCEADIGRAPTRQVPAVSGPLPNATLTLEVPTPQVQQFLATRFALTNTGTTPLAGTWQHCIIDDTVTNSAGKVFTDDIGCRWQGVSTGDETLRPGATTTTTFNLFGDPSSIGLPPLCRAGRWTVQLAIESLLPPVRFAPIPFQVNWTNCSDSPPLAVPGGAPINWAPASYYGVRLGAQLRDAAAPAATASHGETHQPSFRANERIVASIFVDNVSDTTVHLRLGPGAWRVSVTRADAPTDAADVAPIAAGPTAPARDVAVPPHTRLQVGEEALGDRYRLAPADYRVAIGFLALTGPAAQANVRADGFLEDLGNVVVFRLTITP